MTKTADQVQGIRSNRKHLPPVEIVPPNPRLKWVSKAEAIKIEDRRRAANRAAEEARAKVLSQADSPDVSPGDGPEDVPKGDMVEKGRILGAIEDKKALLIDLKDKLGKTHKKSLENPKDTRAKNRAVKLGDEIETEEVALEKLQGQHEALS